MLVCARIKSRHVDDTHYDASEEESVFEMDMETEGIYLEKAVPILDVPHQNQQQRSASTARNNVQKAQWNFFLIKHRITKILIFALHTFYTLPL